MAAVGGYYPVSGQIFTNNARPDFSVFWQVTSASLWEQTYIRAYLSKTFVSNPESDPNAIVFAYGVSTTRFRPVGSFQSIVLPYPANAPSMTQGTWYVRWQMYSAADGATPTLVWNITFPVTMVYTPTSTVLEPIGGKKLVVTANPQHRASFSSVDPTDYATSYQLLVRTGSSSGTIVYDSGKVALAGAPTNVYMYSTLNTTTHKNITLYWSVRFWSKTDTVGNYATYETFSMVDRPTLTVTAPTEAQVLTSGNIALTVTPTTFAGATASQVRVELWTAGAAVWSQISNGTWASGTPIAISGGAATLNNSTSYQYRVTVTDSNGVDSTQFVRNFSTAYTIPAGPAAALTLDSTNFHTLGYVSLTWSGTTHDADFLAWQVERRDLQINVDTGATLETGPWNVIGRNYQIVAACNFRDYLAPVNYKSEYRIKEIALKFNAEIISTTNITATTGWHNTQPMYWLVGGINGSSSTITTVKLYNTTGDTFTLEEERAEFNLIGRGRYSEKGTSLGVRGELAFKIRGTNDGLTPRQKRQQLETFKDAYVSGWLKSPFGDVYKVAVGDMNVTRLSGVGVSEFVDVNVPYTEVV